LKKVIALLIFYSLSFYCFSQNKDSLLISYYNVIKKCAIEYSDTLKKFNIKKAILAIKIVEMDTIEQKLSFAVTDFVLNNEINYINPSFYFKIYDRFVIIKKNENGDYLQEKLNLNKVNDVILKEIEEFLVIKNADQHIHEPFACKYAFSNNTIISKFYSRQDFLPWQYLILN